MSTLEMWLAKFLRRRGWIVMWLDAPARFCAVERQGYNPSAPLVPRFVPQAHEGCWLALYDQQEKR